MYSNLQLQSQDTSLVVSLQDLKDHLAFTNTSSDTRLTEYLYAAQDVISRETNMQFVQTTWLQVWRFFPYMMQTDRFPVASVTSLQYYDDTNTIQTLVEGTDYYSTFPTNVPAVFIPVLNWPFVYQYRPDAVQLTYVCGPVTPALAGHAIKILCSHWNDGNRGENEMDWPKGFERLLRLLRPAVYE